MKIVLAHPFSWPDVRRGAERYLDDLAWYLARAGHDIVVITGTTGPPSVAVRTDGVVVLRRRHLVPGQLERRRIAAEETFGAVAVTSVARARPDVVHALAPSAALAGRMARRPTVFTVLGHLTEDDLAAQPAGGRLTRVAARTATALTALSRSAADRVEAVLGRNAKVIAPGVRLDRFPVEAGPGPRTGPPRVLFSGDAGDPRKGLALLVQAFARFRQHFPEATLVLSGPADHARLIAALDVTPDVVAAIHDAGPGELHEVPARYRAATMTVLPARDEAFGLALVESLASGTPVVCSRSGGMPDVADDPAVSRMFLPGDAEALCAAMVDVVALAAKPETAERCSEHARRWSWDAVGPAHEVLYAEIARR